MAKIELKQPIVQEISETIADAKAVMLVQYLGLTVEQDTAAVVHRVHRPLALVVSAQSGMTPGHRRKVHPHIGAAHPAAHVFPVGQVVPGAVGQAEKAPDLRLFLSAKQGQAAAQQDPYGRQQEQHPADPQRRWQRGVQI